MNRLGYSVSITLFFLTTALSSVAATPPPKQPFDNFTWKPSLKEKPSVGLRMGDFYVEFEKTTLDEVRQAVGVGEIAQEGDAGSSLYWLCYTNLDSQRVERIWIRSHGEMGGPNHEINGVDAERLEKGAATKDCPLLPSKLKPMSLDRGIWLNTSSSFVRATLGEPSYKKGSWKSFDHQGKVHAGGSCEPSGFDQHNSLMMKFKKGKTNSLHTWQVTSC